MDAAAGAAIAFREELVQLKLRLHKRENGRPSDGKGRL